MARIELMNINHSYELGECLELPPDYDVENSCVLKALDLTWEDGTANALLGPSGCGKTTLLNLISGIIRPTVGRIFIGGKDVTKLSPRERHIAQVFQFPVVYDTMTVFGNLAFPLKNAGISKSNIAPRVEYIADVLDMKDLLSRPAGEISQAEKQKVSLGRGLVREDTGAILLDEPLTVIDPKEKYILRRQLREVQKELKVTMIYVTHDQHEALTFADQVTVIKDGRVVQSGSPEELHSHPKTPFIGYFIGSPGMNLLECSRKEDVLDFGEFTYRISSQMKDQITHFGSQFLFGIRPEFIEVSQQEKEGWPSLTTEVVENMGSYQIITLKSNGIRIKSRAPDTMSIAENDPIWLHFPEERITFFDKEVGL